MFNKKSVIFILLSILCIVLTLNSISAIDNTNSIDNLTMDETNSVEKLSPNEFDDGEAKDWAGPIKLEDMDVHADKSLPTGDIQELRSAKNNNNVIVKQYSYTTSDGYKLVKIKSNTYKTIYVDKNGLSDLKGYKSTDLVYKKIPKSIKKIKYDKKLSKKIYKYDWDIKKRLTHNFCV
ncbi:hypothetical protein [uncultured Methanobrevibacter sp.]|uniref:hypothetical protein n=1 Tax=uncultured Methanobrevibacter sp. TaxID=253161 RepID=UPI0025E03843|nr:hypothetical protein [uncultured Methanobrevibacter sp.]